MMREREPEPVADRSKRRTDTGKQQGEEDMERLRFYPAGGPTVALHLSRD